MVSSLLNKNEWYLSKNKSKSVDLSDNSESFMQESEKHSTTHLSLTPKLGKLRVSNSFRISLLKKSPYKKLDQSKENICETAKLILLDQPKINYFEKSPENLSCKKDKGKGLSNKFRVILKKQKEDKRSQRGKKNLKTSTSTSFAQHLKSLASNNEIYPRLEEVLNDKKAYSGFYDFLKSEYAEENILFVSEVEKYKKLENKNSIKTKADEIFQTYVLEDSPMEINLAQKTRMDINEKLNNLEASLFDQAHQHIMFLLESGSFKRFLSVYMKC